MSRGLCTHQSHLYLHICMSLSSSNVCANFPLLSLIKTPVIVFKALSKSDIILLGAGERSPKWQWLKDKEGKKPVKTEQRVVKGRSEDRVRPSGRAALLTKPNLHRAGPVGIKKHQKRGQRALPPPRVHKLFLSLSPRPPTLHTGALLHSLLFFEDGFPCYLLNKIEL